MSIYVPPRPAIPQPLKAGPIGSGAGVLLTEFPLATILGRSAQAKMRQAYKIGMEVPWVRKAEGVIASKVSTVPITLEDQAGENIDDDYPDPNAVAAYDLLTTPQRHIDVGQPLTRTQLWRLTSRHMGLCGNAFWLNDAMNAFGIPAANLYIRPDRMTPNEDANGNLRSWQIDKTAQKPGIEVSLEQVLHFMLEPPDEGHFGPGLVETWLLRARITTALDQQLAQVLGSGGRITGILSPKTGSIEPGSDTALQMERDWRNITEQPDAARRLQIVYAPVEFQKTTLTMDELKIVELMKLMRDDGLAFWGVPPAMAGVPAPSGLNSGDTRKYDEAALWQGSVHDRLIVISEMLQDNLLDRFEGLLGYAPALLLDEPAFDDDSPRYDLLGKSINIAMRNSERRDLVGLPPFGDPAIDDAVWLPMTMTSAFAAPSDAATPTSTEATLGRAPKPIAIETPSDAASLAAGETTQGKAKTTPLRASLVALRERLQTTLSPKLRAQMQSFLAEQKTDIRERLAANATHVRQNPRDTSVWFDKGKWDTALRNALGGPLSGVAQTVDAHIASALAPTTMKADPVERILLRGAARVTRINDTTRDAIAALLATSIEQGGTIQDAIDALDTLDIFDEARAEVIARTELMDAYNGAALGAYGDAGVTEVQAIDGDGDPECAERDGQTFSVEEADTIEDHPNGTLDWVPVIDTIEEAPVKAVIPAKAVIIERPTEPEVVPVRVAHALELYLAERDAIADRREQKATLDAAAATSRSDEQIAAIMDRLTTLAEAASAPREMPAPQVTINVPEQPAPVAPVVHVHVPEAAAQVAPDVHVHVPPQPKRIVKTVSRDRQGQITGSIEESA